MHEFNTMCKLRLCMTLTLGVNTNTYNCIHDLNTWGSCCKLDKHITAVVN